jgi:hypothetical protein
VELDLHLCEDAENRKSGLSPSQAKLLEDAEIIWSEDAVKAGALTFWPRSMLQLTLPHKDPGNVSVWGRRSGDYYLVIEPGHYIDANGNPATHGFPYGSLPRLIFSYMNREAKRTKKPLIGLGDSLSSFMNELGLGPYRTGGKNGNITRLRKQMAATLSSRISYGYAPNDAGEKRANRNVAEEYELWWDPKFIDQRSLYPNWVKIDERMFEEFMRHGVPVDMRALKALKRSPLALDLYSWATYRNHSLKGQLAIPWSALHKQFGAEYAREDNFVRKAKAEFKKVQVVYPDLKIHYERGRLILGQSRTHIITKI